MRKTVSSSVLIAGIIFIQMCIFTPVISALQVAPVFEKSFHLGILTSYPIQSNDRSAIASFAQILRGVQRRAQQWGVAPNTQVHVMLFTDTEFLCHDLWESAGLSPDATTLDSLEKESLTSFSSPSNDQLLVALEKMEDKWFFLNLPTPMQRISDQFAGLNADELSCFQSDIQKSRTKIETSWSQSFGDNLNQYYFFDSAMYCFPVSTIWMRVKNFRGLASNCGSLLHEYGHHIFYHMVQEVFPKALPGKTWVKKQIEAISSPLLAVNEFFADYNAFTNGHPLLINEFPTLKEIPLELKREFQQQRTLAGYIQNMESSPPQIKAYLAEGHNTLNPCRTLVVYLHFRMIYDLAENLISFPLVIVSSFL